MKIIPVKVTERQTFYVREKFLSRDFNERESDGCNHSLLEIEIGEGITCIEEGAFENCKSLVKVTLPASVKIIRRNAFAGCTALKTVEVPDGLERVAHDGDKWASDQLTPLSLTQGLELQLYYKGDDDPRRWD